ncbi:G_PROTEIN_RECEP_F3_4 domain-containing protein [Lamellibrachia satsuma]|nr:G_PROTEIN_RECEP_F3_4 domain-containing protein [Lamellibrachia satsuma]
MDMKTPTRPANLSMCFGERTTASQQPGYAYRPPGIVSRAQPLSSLILPHFICVAVIGRGFMRGSYMCVCQRGFYFPNISAENKFFNGTDLERYAFNASHDVTSTAYRCLSCSIGCDECEDATPCLYANNLILRWLLVVLTTLVVFAILASSILVTVFRSAKVIKSASPFFLHIMNVGAALMCVPVGGSNSESCHDLRGMFVLFPEPTDLTCLIRSWPQHIGFCLAYGAVLLKTWRVSAIFRVQSAQRVIITDRMLARRFVPILAVAIGFMSAWTVIAKPSVAWHMTSSELKFKYCQTVNWEYVAFVGEAAFLLWGAYLCFVVRHVPSHFNESRYITWTIYNTVILGSFTLVIRHALLQFIAISQGPDAIYMADFIYYQVSVTAMIALIFVPKFFALYKHSQIMEGNKGVDTSYKDSRVRPGGTIYSIQTKRSSHIDFSVTQKDQAVQTELFPGDVHPETCCIQESGRTRRKSLMQRKTQVFPVTLVPSTHSS